MLQCEGTNIFEISNVIMQYSDYEKLLSVARMSKYIKACRGDKAKAIRLYHYNIKLSGRMFAVINMFEIILRNSIDKHYQSYFSDPDWMIHQIGTGKMFSESELEISQKSKELIKDKKYSPDRMVSSFMMGFWTYMFTKRHYKQGGKTLLQIFPNKPKGTTQKIVYSELSEIRELRNRIAHHEPICFDTEGNAGIDFAAHHYALIIKYLSAMGLDEKSVLHWIESPEKVMKEIKLKF